MAAWLSVKNSLRYPALLQKCSWQELMSSIGRDTEPRWLCDTVGQNYGIV